MHGLFNKKIIIMSVVGLWSFTCKAVEDPLPSETPALVDTMTLPDDPLTISLFCGGFNAQQKHIPQHIQHIVIFNQSPCAEFSDCSDCEEMRQVDTIKWVNLAKLSPDGRWLAVGSGVRDWEDKDPLISQDIFAIWENDPSGLRRIKLPTIFRGFFQNLSITQIEWSKDAKHVAILLHSLVTDCDHSWYEFSIELWDTTSWTLVFSSNFCDFDSKEEFCTTLQAQGQALGIEWPEAIRDNKENKDHIEFMPNGHLRATW